MVACKDCKYLYHSHWVDIEDKCIRKLTNYDEYDHKNGCYKTIVLACDESNKDGKCQFFEEKKKPVEITQEMILDRLDARIRYGIIRPKIIKLLSRKFYDESFVMKLIQEILEKEANR